MKARRPLRHLAAMALRMGGFTTLCRRLPSYQPCVLMFHGVRQTEDPRLFNHDLHVPVDLFKQVCLHLKKVAKVVPLRSLADAIREGKSLPRNGVALTFDDGYASNYELAYPILKELDFPATIFPATGFLDGEEFLWFNQLEYILANTRHTVMPDGPEGITRGTPINTLSDKKNALNSLCAVVKSMPQEDIPAWICQVEEALDVRLREVASQPDVLRPLSWDQVREMRRSGLVEFGGHTHHHWIVSRTSPVAAEKEIALCRSRLMTELGENVDLFAYPNGSHGDFSDATTAQLKEQGYTMAVTTLPGRVQSQSEVLTLPRYGTPVSVADAEMTVSGAYEQAKRLRNVFKRHRAPASPPVAKRKPTVLHVIRSLGGGGAEMMLCNLVEQMKSSSWRSVVVSVVGGNANWQVERMRLAADAFYTLDDRPALRLRHVRKLRAIMRHERPDVVQTWIHRMDLAGGVVARSAGCRRVVWGLHSLGMAGSPGESSFKLGFYRWLLRISSRLVPRLIVSCSNAGIRTHEDAGYPRRRMLWIPNGICTKRFVPDHAAGLAKRQALDLPCDAPVIGFIGRFHPVKCLPVFFQAAALLQEKMPEVHFLLCGGTEEDLEPAAAAAWKSMPRPQQVRLAPFGREPEKFYPALTLFSMSSGSEALPMVLLEAMACEIPCVATDVGDCAEVIGGLGRVVPPGQPAALASAWQEMLQLSETERLRLAGQVRERVVKNFSVETCAQQYEAAYSRLMEVQ